MVTFKIVFCIRLYGNEVLQVAEVIRTLMPPGSVSIWMLCVFALSNYSVITSGLLMTVSKQHKEVREITPIFNNTDTTNTSSAPHLISFYGVIGSTLHF